MRFGRMSRMRNQKHDPRELSKRKEKKNGEKKKRTNEMNGNSRRSLDGVDLINASKMKNRVTKRLPAQIELNKS